MAGLEVKEVKEPISLLKVNTRAKAATTVSSYLLDVPYRAIHFYGVAQPITAGPAVNSTTPPITPSKEAARAATEVLNVSPFVDAQVNPPPAPD